MPDDPTLGEVKRRVETGLTDVKEDIRNLVDALDRRVSMERYQLEKEARDKEIRELLERVKGIEDARKEQDKQRAADRRLIFSALVVPVLLILLQVYLSTRGAGA